MSATEANKVFAAPGHHKQSSGSTTQGIMSTTSAKGPMPVAMTSKRASGPMGPPPRRPLPPTPTTSQTEAAQRFAVNFPIPPHVKGASTNDELPKVFGPALPPPLPPKKPAPPPRANTHPKVSFSEPLATVYPYNGRARSASSASLPASSSYTPFLARKISPEARAKLQQRRPDENVSPIRPSTSEGNTGILRSDTASTSVPAKQSEKYAASTLSLPVKPPKSKTGVLDYISNKFLPDVKISPVINAPPRSSTDTTASSAETVSVANSHSGMPSARSTTFSIPILGRSHTATSSVASSPEEEALHAIKKKQEKQARDAQKRALKDHEEIEKLKAKAERLKQKRLADEEKAKDDAKKAANKATKEREQRRLKEERAAEKRAEVEEREASEKREKERKEQERLRAKGEKKSREEKDRIVAQRAQELAKAEEARIKSRMAEMRAREKLMEKAVNDLKKGGRGVSLSEWLVDHCDDTPELRSWAEQVRDLEVEIREKEDRIKSLKKNISGRKAKGLMKHLEKVLSPTKKTTSVSSSLGSGVTSSSPTAPVHHSLQASTSITPAVTIEAPPPAPTAEKEITTTTPGRLAPPPLRPKLHPGHPMARHLPGFPEGRPLSDIPAVSSAMEAEFTLEEEEQCVMDLHAELAILEDKHMSLTLGRKSTMFRLSEAFPDISEVYVPPGLHTPSPEPEVKAPAESVKNRVSANYKDNPVYTAHLKALMALEGRAGDSITCEDFKNPAIALGAHQSPAERGAPSEPEEATGDDTWMSVFDPTKKTLRRKPSQRVYRVTNPDPPSSPE